ncbi:MULTISPECIES: hypothetical protein [unclassified Nostoc]|nr:hypothetical protein [Nostoc sp. 'Peltigera membranacea cyanobiont' 210A]
MSDVYDGLFGNALSQITARAMSTTGYAYARKYISCRHQNHDFH